MIRKSVPNELQIPSKIDQNRHRIATSKHIKRILAQKWGSFLAFLPSKIHPKSALKSTGGSNRGKAKNLLQISINNQDKY